MKIQLNNLPKKENSVNVTQTVSPTKHNVYRTLTNGKKFKIRQIIHVISWHIYFCTKNKLSKNLLYILQVNKKHLPA